MTSDSGSAPVGGQSRESIEAREIFQAARHVADAYQLWWTGSTGERWAHDTEVEERLQALVKSIRYRSDSLAFHVRLLEETAAGAHDQIQSQIRARPGFLRSVAAQQQYFFDDLVFNVMSLFDYIGYFIGFVVSSSGKPVKWSSAYGKVKREAPGSSLQAAMTDANRSLVNKMKKYRAGLIHNLSDEVDGWVRHDYVDGALEVRIKVPERFVAGVSLPGVNKDTSIQAAGHRTLNLAYDLAYWVLVALAKHLRTTVWENAPPNPRSMQARWRLAGYAKRVGEDEAVRAAGVDSCGALVTDESLHLVLHLQSGESLYSDPVSLTNMFNARTFDGDEVEAAFRMVALAALQSHNLSKDRS